ncbi:MAG: metal ABC transporter permease [Planctomycetaceae bacterium]
MMSALNDWTFALDGWIVITGALCAVAAALLGNFLVLRKLSMLGDAITHAVLPGLAVAFFISGTRNSVPMFAGAVVVGLLTAVFTEWVRGIGRVDEGASMGVVFTSLFALGLVMIVQAADHVDLDPGCVLYGSLESIPLDLLGDEDRRIPQPTLTLAVVASINLLFVVVFFKELKITSFDPGLATSTGFHAGLMHYALMVLVAVTAVASFETVGSILVVAMLIVPPAAAYMLTDRLTTMIVLSVILAALSALLGHAAALIVPSWFGFGSTTTAGMMAVVAGLLFLLAAVLGPRHGILVKFVRRQVLALRILADDVVALLYRLEEKAETSAASLTSLQDLLLADQMSLRTVLKWLRIRDELDVTDSGYVLTEHGRARARGLVRSHRLWEQYLVSLAGIPTDRIHDKAERLEHFTDQELRDRLDEATEAPTIDPHGSEIPAEK